jgi:putative SOS response-associated peptidase YedK
MAPIHDRMPVILQPADFDVWLDPQNHDSESLRSLMHPCAAELMTAYPVSPAINRSSVDGPTCIEWFGNSAEN